MTLYLETKSTGRWRAVDSEVVTEIPFPKAVSLLVIADCRPGTWRLRYAVDATDKGHRASFSDASDSLGIRTSKECAVAR